MSYLKVEGRPNLVRDTESGAILNTSKGAVEQYIMIREKHENKDKQIAQMQSDIDELKQLVKQLVEKENASNTHTVTETTDNLSQLVTNVNTISKDVGATGKLTTTQDSDIVGAINELDAEIGSVTLTTTAQTLTGAIQEIFQGGFEELDLTLDSVKSSTGLALGGFSDSERSSLGKALNALSRDIQDT